MVGRPGRERAIVSAGNGPWFELAEHCPRLDADRLRRGFDDIDELLRDGALQPLTDEVDRWGAPIERPGKIIGIGLNYHAHAAEIGAQSPHEPVVFLKANTSFSGPCDDIVLLPGATTTDYEVELGVVIGATLRSAADDSSALAGVAGYLLAQDVSDRDLQLHRGGTWTKGKSADTYCPVGPYLVTPDEISTAGVDLSLRVNDEVRQQGNTSDLIFSVPAVLRYVSALMTLEPGDLVITGTPAGVAMARPDERPYLRAGDVVVAESPVLGRQRCRVVDPAKPRFTEP